MTRRRSVRPSSVGLVVLAVVWLYPLAWTLANAVRSSADIYRAPWDVPWPPVVANLGEAWGRAQLGVALLNSLYVTGLTVAIVLLTSVAAAYALSRLRPPGRALLFLLVLAPLIIPTEVLIVPMFSLFRTLGLINSLPGLAVFNAVVSTRETIRPSRNWVRSTCPAWTSLTDWMAVPLSASMVTE
jgi:ABC-type glycerol-3-phosphate transport system permease component